MSTTMNPRQDLMLKVVSGLQSSHDHDRIAALILFITACDDGTQLGDEGSVRLVDVLAAIDLAWFNRLACSPGCPVSLRPDLPYHVLALRAVQILFSGRIPLPLETRQKWSIVVQHLIPGLVDPNHCTPVLRSIKTLLSRNTADNKDGSSRSSGGSSSSTSEFDVQSATLPAGSLWYSAQAVRHSIRSLDGEMSESDKDSLLQDVVLASQLMLASVQVSGLTIAALTPDPSYPSVSSSSSSSSGSSSTTGAQATTLDTRVKDVTCAFFSLCLQYGQLRSVHKFPLGEAISGLLWVFAPSRESEAFDVPDDSPSDLISLFWTHMTSAGDWGTQVHAGVREIVLSRLPAPRRQPALVLASQCIQLLGNGWLLPLGSKVIRENKEYQKFFRIILSLAKIEAGLGLKDNGDSRVIRGALVILRAAMETLGEIADSSDPLPFEFDALATIQRDLTDAFESMIPYLADKHPECTSDLSSISAKMCDPLLVAVVSVLCQWMVEDTDALRVELPSILTVVVQVAFVNPSVLPTFLPLLLDITADDVLVLELLKCSGVQLMCQYYSRHSLEQLHRVLTRQAGNDEAILVSLTGSVLNLVTYFPDLTPMDNVISVCPVLHSALQAALSRGDFDHPVAYSLATLASVLLPYLHETSQIANTRNTVISFYLACHSSSAVGGLESVEDHHVVQFLQTLAAILTPEHLHALGSSVKQQLLSCTTNAQALPCVRASMDRAQAYSHLLAMLKS